MGRLLALLSLAVLIVGIAAIDPCKRQPFRGRCPSENGAAPKRSQFVLRYYARNGECVSYPYGHCASDESEPTLYRYKEECEDACIENKPGNLGEPKSETYGTIGPLDAKAEGVKIVTQEPLSITDTPTTKSTTTTEQTTTTEATTTTEKSTQAPTTTTEKTTTVAETTTEEVTTQKSTTTEEPTTTTVKSTTVEVTTEKATEAPSTEAPTTKATTTTTEEPKTTVKETEAPKVEKKVEATTAAQKTSTTTESTTARTIQSTTPVATTKKVVVVQAVTEPTTEATKTEAAETTRTPRTECERRRTASTSSKIRGGFIPVCDANGEFERTQCEPNGEQCFCVDRRGIEVANSRFHEGKKPNCEQIAAAPRTHVKSCGGVAERGPCSSNLGRWFYSASEKKCMQFIYSGCGGNGNNFDHESDCLAKCGATQAPVFKCLKGEPLKSKQGEVVSCGKTECPTGYKCTQQQQTSFCCPEEADKLVVAKPAEELNSVCKQDKERGPCDKYELRFYYNAEIKECKYFFWGGCEGNGNNFVDIEACEQTCGISKARGFTNAPRTQTPRTTLGIRITPGNQQITTTTEEPETEVDPDDEETDAPTTTTSAPTRARPVPTTRQAHREPATTVTPATARAVQKAEDLPRREQHQTVNVHPEILHRRPIAVIPMLSENRCVHPKDSGNCRGQFIRWYWDSQKKLCDVFTYTGCEGNGNNFASREECMAICHKEVVRPVVPDFSNVCKHDVDAGECNGVFQRFAFDNESGECRPFTYGGCGGNGNNFATIAECRLKCQKIAVVKPVNMCDNDIEAGECTGVFTRFAYDKEINDCRQFVYGGCGGNGNNFPSITECRTGCVKKACKPTPPCDPGRCQLLNDKNGCAFCSCEPTKQPAPPAPHDRCPQINFSDCQEPCMIIHNRRGCQECKCPHLPSSVSPPVAQPPAPSRFEARAPSTPVVVGPPAPHTVAPPSPPFRGNGVTEGVRITHGQNQPAIPTEILGDLQEKCMQPVEPGPCTNFSDRWFFSSEDGSCHPFKYGGCAGNRNHFYTQRECEIHCARFLRSLSTSEEHEVEHEQDLTHEIEPIKPIELTPTTARPRKHEKQPSFDIPAIVRANAVANHQVEKHAELPNIREASGKTAPYPETYDWHTEPHTTKHPAKPQQRERVIETHKELFYKSNEELQELPSSQEIVIQQHQVQPVLRTVVQHGKYSVVEAPRRPERPTTAEPRHFKEATTPVDENVPAPQVTTTHRQEQRVSEVAERHFAAPARQETVKVAPVQHAIPLQPRQHGAAMQQNTYGMNGIESYNPQMNPNLQGLSPPVDPTYFSYNNQNMGHRRQFAVNQVPFENRQPVPVPEGNKGEFQKPQNFQNFNQQFRGQTVQQQNLWQNQPFQQGLIDQRPVQQQLRQHSIQQVGPQQSIHTGNRQINTVNAREEPTLNTREQFQERTPVENRNVAHGSESRHQVNRPLDERRETVEIQSPQTGTRGHVNQHRSQNPEDQREHQPVENSRTHLEGRRLENHETFQQKEATRAETHGTQRRPDVNNRVQTSNTRLPAVRTSPSEENDGRTSNRQQTRLIDQRPQVRVEQPQAPTSRVQHSRNFQEEAEEKDVHQYHENERQHSQQPTIQRPQLNIQPIQSNQHREMPIAPKRIQFTENQQRTPNAAAARGIATATSFDQHQKPDVVINTDNQRQWIYFDGDYYGPTIPGVRVSRPGGLAPLESVDATIVARHRESHSPPTAQAPSEAFEAFKKEAANFQRSAGPFMHAARNAFEVYRNGTIINKKHFEQANTNEDELLILNAPKVLVPDTKPRQMHELPETTTEEIEEIPRFLLAPPNQTLHSPNISSEHPNRIKHEPVNVSKTPRTLNARPAPHFLPIDNFSKTMQLANQTVQMNSTLTTTTTNQPPTRANQESTIPLAQLNIRKIIAGPADNKADSEEEEEDEVTARAFGETIRPVVSPIPVPDYSSPTPVTVAPIGRNPYGKKQHLQILPIAATQSLEAMNGKAPVTTQGVKVTPTTGAPSTTTTTTTVKSTTTEEAEPEELTTLEEKTTSMTTISETVTSTTLATILSNSKLATPTLETTAEVQNTVVENTTTEKPKEHSPTTVVNEVESMESEDDSDEQTDAATKPTAKPVVTSVSEKEEREMYISSKFHNEKVLKETDEVRKFEEISLPAKGATPEVEQKELKKLEIQKIPTNELPEEEYEDEEEDTTSTTGQTSVVTTTVAPSTTTTEAKSPATNATDAPTVAVTEPTTVSVETSPVTTVAPSTIAEPSTTVSVTTATPPTTQGTISSSKTPEPSTQTIQTIPTTKATQTTRAATAAQESSTSTQAPATTASETGSEEYKDDSDESDIEQVVIVETPKVNGVTRVEPKDDKEIVTRIDAEAAAAIENERPISIGKVPVALDLDKIDETITKEEPQVRPVPTTAAPTTTKAATTAEVQAEVFDARVVCAFPADAGSCFNYVTRWFFNSQSGQCEQFSFGQCGGNANNFNDRTTCELKCMIAHPTLTSEISERCTYDKDPGFGQGYYAKWYFNMKNLRCERFVYEGQGGNSNQFETLSDCERICTPLPRIEKPTPASIPLAQTAAPTTVANEAPSTQAHTVNTEPATARPTTVIVPSVATIGQTVQTTRAAAPPAPQTATAASRQLKPLPDISANKGVEQMSSNEIEKEYDEEFDNDLIPAVPNLAPQVHKEDPQVLPAVPEQPQPIQPFEPQAPKVLTVPAAAPGTEPRPPAHASKTIQIEEIEKPVPEVFQETTTKQPQYTASPISVSSEPNREEFLPRVAPSPKETVNYQTGRRVQSGIQTFGEEKLSVEKLSEISNLPSCPNNNQELRHPNTGAPIMCLPGKNQCPGGSNCYFNGVNFFCCPNIEDPYDKHAFGGYGGDEVKNGYKVFGPLRIRRLMDEVPLRAKRQTSMDMAFNTVPVSFNLDSVIAPLRFDAEKPRTVSRAERMKKPRPPQHGNPMCLQALIKGDCKEAHLRYFYDRNTDSCRLFYYSGCQGNANNFGSLEDCQRLCVLGNQPRESYVQAAPLPTPSVIAPGQCPTGAPLGGSAPVLCGNSTDSIGCPTGYHCRAGPPDVCCPGVQTAATTVVENKAHGIKQHPVESATSSVEETSAEAKSRRGYHKERLLATPKYMCPDASDPLMGSNGEPLVCGAGFDGMKMCPKGFYCAIDAEKGSRLCCPLYGAAQRIPAEQVLAPYFGRRGANPGEVIGRGSLPSDVDQDKPEVSSEHASREKSTEVPVKNIEFDVTGAKDVPSTSAPTSSSVEVTTKKAEDDDSEEYEDEEEDTTKPQRLMLKDNNRHQRLQEKTASESPKAADVPAETMNIDMPKETAAPAIEETPEITKSMNDKSICHIKPSEGRACRSDEKAPRTNLQYFYSARDNKCKLYFFKGCGGNENRFEKKVECEELCLRK